MSQMRRPPHLKTDLYRLDSKLLLLPSFFFKKSLYTEVLCQAARELVQLYFFYFTISWFQIFLIWSNNYCYFRIKMSTILGGKSCNFQLFSLDNGMMTIPFRALGTVVHRPKRCSLPTAAIKDVPSFVKANAFMFPSTWMVSNFENDFKFVSTL